VTVVVTVPGGPENCVAVGAVNVVVSVSVVPGSVVVSSEVTVFVSVVGTVDVTVLVTVEPCSVEVLCAVVVLVPYFVVVIGHVTVTVTDVVPPP
jgi:hypothetical protein